MAVFNLHGTLHAVATEAEGNALLAKGARRITSTPAELRSDLVAIAPSGPVFADAAAKK